MSNRDVQFIGSIPENYDRFLGPMLFEPFARDLVQRLSLPPTSRVLELACGTGILTRRLRAHLPPTASLVATDLNEPMLEYARARFGPAPGVTWQQADAANLPFPDAGFDAVVCQFGLMFVPDKAAAVREVRRVLVPGGVFAFNTWAAIEDNPFAQLAHETVASFFPADPPTFYLVPFSMPSRSTTEELLAEAGFQLTDACHVTLQATSPTALDAARGLVLGNPILLAIQERGTTAPETIVASLADALARAGGDRPLRHPMRALVFIARAGGPK